MGNKSSSSKGGGKSKGSGGGGDQLVLAAKAGDVAAVTKLLKSGEFDINDRHEGIVHVYLVIWYCLSLNSWE